MPLLDISKTDIVYRDDVSNLRVFYGVLMK